MHHASTFKKVAIIFVLVCFLLSTGLVSLLYLADPTTPTNTGSVDAIPTVGDTGTTETLAPGSILNAFSTGN